MKKYISTLVFALGTLLLAAQRPAVEILTKGTRTSLRGLSVVNDNVIWVSGSNGTVGRSSNGGKTWKWMLVKGFEKNDFRDIEAFDANSAIIMAVADPAYILRTSDGGDSWTVVYENKQKGMFLDAMDFATPYLGMVIGDPVDGKIFIARTQDGGNTWRELPRDSNTVVPDSGEAFFASSGTNVRVFANGDYFIASGGRRSRLFRNNTPSDLAVMQGKESTGANSVDIYDNGIPDKPGERMVVVGGDFAADSLTTGNCVYTVNGGKTWHAPKVPPHGYRSCVEYLSKKDLLACGINGVDHSGDGGKTWTWISKEGFNACRIARIGSSIFLVGSNGKIGRIKWTDK